MELRNKYCIMKKNSAKAATWPGSSLGFLKILNLTQLIISYKIISSAKIYFIFTLRNKTVLGLPLLKLSLDFTSLPAALAVALKIAGAMDTIEVGTLLYKSARLEAIRAVSKVYPDKLIYVDFKTPDVEALEAEMAFDAGPYIRPMTRLQPPLRCALKSLFYAGGLKNCQGIQKRGAVHSKVVIYKS
jgi:hypothetical protein